MTHKPEKLVPSKRRVWEMNTEPRRGSRTSLKPTLLLGSPEDSVAEKLVEHHDHSGHTYHNNVPNNIATDQRDFNPWFCKPINNNHPDFLITSHQSKTQLRLLRSKTRLPSLFLNTELQSFQSKTRARAFHAKNQQSSLSVYPSLVDPTVKWNTNIQSSFVSIDDSQVNEQHDDNCWCESCTTARRSAGFGLNFKSLAPTLSPAFDRSVFFRDNIVTFCNQCTMTPRLNDVSCGSSQCAIPLLITTDVGTSGTILNTPQSSKSCRRNSILKKSQYDACEDLNRFTKSWLDHRLPAPHVDDSSCNGKTKPTKCYPRSACLQSSNNNVAPCTLESGSNRKMLYNEGISDEVAKQLCVIHKKHPPVYDINEETCSRLSIGGRCYRDKSDNYIPYSHNVNSKYHQNCKKEVQPLMHKRSYVLRGLKDNECRNFEFEPLVLKKSSAGVCLTHSRCISLPKRVLTSERNIEAFLKPKCIR